jgi:hypothetical protein
MRNSGKPSRDFRILGFGPEAPKVAIRDRIWGLRSKDWADLFFSTFTLIGGGLLLSALLILGYQVIAWLRFGEWWTLNGSMVVSAINRGHSPKFSWVGVEQIVNLLLGLPLALHAFVLGSLAFFLALPFEGVAMPRDK